MNLDRLGDDGRYELTERLSTGGMGDIWKATDTRLRRTVVVKIIRLDTEHPAWPEAVTRFTREAEIGARLSHPGLTVIHDLIEYPAGEHAKASEVGRALVMEYLDGEPLAQVIETADRPLPFRWIVDLGHQVLSALAAAHADEVIHRDVKPGNIMVLRNGQVKLIDFGIATARSLTAGLTKGFVGTCAYAAPERIDGKPVDARADLYSFGVVLYELLVGVPPFSGDEAALLNAHVNTPPLDPRQRRPEIPERLAELTLCLLRKEPAERPHSADRVLDELGTIENVLPPLLEGRYELSDLLARGGVSSVHRATDVRTGRNVAIRMLSPDLLNSPGARTAFQRDTGGAAVLPVRHQGETRIGFTLPYTVMELPDGHTLRDRMTGGTAMPSQQAMPIIDDILSALDRSHHAGVAHPGLTPDTVFFAGERDEVRFMNAEAISATTTAQADLRAVAGLLYELLTNRPFSAGARLPSQENPHVPPWCDDLFLRALADGPAQPFRDAGEFRGAIAVAANSPAPPPQPPTSPPAGSPAHNWPMILGYSVVFVLVFAVMFLFAFKLFG